MDPITHAISGIVLARALPRHPMPRSQVILLAALTMLPDADYILTFISDIVYLQYHRGITHSILMLPLWTWLIYVLLGKTRSAIPAWLIAAAIALHIGLDLITSFGTMILAPFYDWRATLDLVFIIDPLFTACLLIPLLLAFIWKQCARTLAITSFILMCAYLGLTLMMHHAAIQLVRNNQPSALTYSALPMPFSPFHWQLIASYPEHYSQAAVDFLPGFPGSTLLFPDSFVRQFSGNVQPPVRLAWRQFPAMRAQPDIRRLPGVAFYLWFARFPILLEHRPEQWIFGDLRFGAGSNPDSPFRLEINEGKQPRAWLIWSENQRSELRQGTSR